MDQNIVYKLSFEDIIYYSNCSLKLKLKREKYNQTNKELLFDKAIKRALLVYFKKLWTDVSESVAIAAAIKEFDHIWLTESVVIPMNERGSAYESRLLHERIRSFFNPKTDIVVGTNIPIELVINNSLILEDNLDLLLLRYEDNKSKYRAISISDVINNDNKRYLYYKAVFYKYALLGYLKGSSYKDISYEIRSLNGKDFIYNPKLGEKNLLQRIVLNVFKGIKHNVWLPTTSEEECKVCQFKKICKMSLIK